MTYEVGDVVKIKTNLQPGAIYDGVYYVSGMYENRYITISDKDISPFYGDVYLSQENECWYSETMIEKRISQIVDVDYLEWKMGEAIFCPF